MNCIVTRAADAEIIAIDTYTKPPNSAVIGVALIKVRASCHVLYSNFHFTMYIMHCDVAVKYYIFTRDGTIHDLHVLIYCFLNITIWLFVLVVLAHKYSPLEI